MQGQEKTNWCWAAVAASLSSAMPLPPSMNAPLSQCQVASGLSCPGGAQCGCNNASGDYECPNDTCNNLALLESALGKVRHRGNISGGVPQQQDVIAQIDKGLPIAGEIHWNDGQPQNHFVLIVDHGMNHSGDFVVQIADPTDRTGTQPQDHSLAELANGGYRNTGTWINSYFTR